MSWPSIQNPTYPLQEEYFKPQIKQEFESGHVQSRARATVAKRRWTLNWRSLPEADWVSLVAAFNTDQGTTFTWTHPVSGEYTVRYAANSLTSTIVAPNLRTASVALEEAP